MSASDAIGATTPDMNNKIHDLVIPNYTSVLLTLLLLPKRNQS